MECARLVAAFPWVRLVERSTRAQQVESAFTTLARGAFADRQYIGEYGSYPLVLFLVNAMIKVTVIQI